MKRIILSILSMMSMVTITMPTAQADDLFSSDRLSLHGFGTLGVSHLSNENVDYKTNIQPSGPGGTYDVDFGLDSRLGVQLDYALTEHTTATIQTISQRNTDRTFTPHVSLLNLRHEFDNGLAIRVGRIQPTTYLAAEYRLANFSNPWVRPPEVVYGLVPLIEQQAIDVSYPFATEYGIFTGWLGVFKYDVDIGRINQSGTDTAKIRNGRNIGIKWQHGAWLAKAGWAINDTTLETAPLKAALAGVGLFDPAAANALALNNTPVEVFSAGITYEDSDWLMMAEWAARKSHSLLSDTWGAYVTVGRHLGPVLPYLTIGRQAIDDPSVTSSNPIASQIINQIYKSTNFSQWAASIGMSYPIQEKAILKFQIDWIKPDNGSTGPYTNVSAGYDSSHPPTDILISVNLDFIF
ncbi:MAG: hypothetical protein ACKVN9_10595 [Methylophilaceae bacterium]